MAHIRRQRVLPLWVEPRAYDPSTGETILAKSIEVEVTFSGRSSGLSGVQRGVGGQAGRPAADGRRNPT